MARYKVWTTKCGEKIPINKMSDSHLVNTIRMIKRNAQKHVDAKVHNGYMLLSHLQGEMAIDCVERELMLLGKLDNPVGLASQRMSDLYDDMVKLANKRCLEVFYE